MPTLSSPISLHNALQNPRLAIQRRFTALNCKGFQLSVPSHCYSAGGEHTNGGVALKNVDIATLGNLCVDLVLNVPDLPPTSFLERKAYMERLAASPPDKKYWEAGGNCNVAIAAKRLGLCCIAIGHVGNEIYGNFLLDVLHDEGIDTVGMNEDIDVLDSASASYETLLCWVLVDPLQRHGFCRYNCLIKSSLSGLLLNSLLFEHFDTGHPHVGAQLLSSLNAPTLLFSRADFSKEPAFSWMSKLSREVKMGIRKSKILFCNGYGFDELSPSLIVSALDYAVEVGTSVFFDPGPRGKSLSVGTPEEQQALAQFLTMSDVLLLTSDEAESLTGIGNPILAGQELLRKGVRAKWVIVKMGSKGSILISMSSVSCAPAFKVNVIDTVGCGDSFVAAIAFGFIHKLPTVNTLAIANAVGAATAMGCGAGRNVANLEQVIEIMKASNLNEDDRFWNELLDDNLDAQQIMFLSKTAINGSSNGLHLVALQKVVSESLCKLETAWIKGVV